MQNPSLPAAAFLAAILVLVPLPWHWRARNIGTLAIMAWLFVLNLIYGINTIVWAGNVNNPVPVWCDITTKIIIGANSALPIATMCVCKHLELVSSNRRVRFDHVDRRRRIIFDSLMCFGLPLIFMALHYVVQGHRYDILENFGCQPTVYFSVPAIFIVYVPPLAFSLATLVYASLALYHFVRRRISFATHLQNSNSTLTTHRYLRLMAMAVTEIVWGTALTSFDLYNNIAPGLRVWDNWADVHSNFSRVDLFATIELPPAFLNAQYLFWWSMPASAFIFFIFFGFGEEARKEYSKVISLFRRHVLRQSPQQDSFVTGSLPNSRTLRPLKISSLRSFRLSDEKVMSAGSTSPTTTISRTPVKVDGNFMSHSLSVQHSEIPPLPTYSTDVEAGHHRLSTNVDSSEEGETFLEMDESFPVPRAYTTSMIVEAGSVTLPSNLRPFSSPSICPAHLPRDGEHDCDGVQVTVQTVHHRGDELV
ncbi:hypothetical protein HYDPIDRAFT_154822 [Hydnomerulius pinastri MD-312]|uniref:Uncharacterized protein n=1 Tax=Hydnomerulius pinastri MD-312 TaxID=994086 RepID=A0A0C9W9F6_9AGAM|nr:hypothetical protein HYDPIDRAFT_154822 [Hydnomerulius pinastri MD-312]